MSRVLIQVTLEPADAKLVVDALADKIQVRVGSSGTTLEPFGRAGRERAIGVKELLEAHLKVSGDGKGSMCYG